jgi:arylsulfatase A-like enzyme
MLAWSNRELVPAGAVCNEPVNSVDQFPTLLGLAGLPVPSDLPGVDMSGWIRGEKGRTQRDVLLGCDYLYWRGIYDGRHLLAYAHVEADLPCWVMNDTARDPYDLHNVVTEPRYESTRDDLLQRLIKRLRDAGDDRFIEACLAKPVPYSQLYDPASHAVIRR